MYIYREREASQVAQWVKSLPAAQETQGRKDPLAEGMGTHSSVLAWRNSWTEEPGRLHRVTKSQTDITKATDYFPIRIISEHWVVFPVLYNRSLKVVYLIWVTGLEANIWVLGHMGYPDRCSQEEVYSLLSSNGIFLVVPPC